MAIFRIVARSRLPGGLFGRPFRRLPASALHAALHMALHCAPHFRPRPTR